jgi:hypothetical protein
MASRVTPGAMPAAAAGLAGGAMARWHSVQLTLADSWACEWQTRHVAVPTSRTISKAGRTIRQNRD